MDNEREEDLPRYQGKDDDVFVEAECGPIYDQTDGEEMAKRIASLESQLKDREHLSEKSGHFTEVIAAIPLAVAMQPMPPSSWFKRLSRAVVVGLAIRV